MDAPDALSCETDSALLGIILGNLCGNAAEHAPAGTTIAVEAVAGPNSVSISFSNRATDLTEADLPNLFERFWRKDAARTESRHHGLGLALSADFAHLLGGKLSATLDQASNLKVLLSLPSARPQTPPNSQLATPNYHHTEARRAGTEIPLSTQVTNLHEIKSTPIH
jgi:signal transduction histidine kinase